MVVDLLKDLVSIPSVSGDEGEVMSFLHSYLEEKGFNVNRVGKNLVFSLGSGDRKMVFNSHLDTVKPSGWEKNPFKPLEKDGKVFGVGTSDNKGSAAAMVKSAEKINEEELEKEVFFTFTEREEVDGAGMKKIMKWLKDERGVEKAVGIVGEPTDLEKVLEGCKGTAWLELEVFEDGGHASKDLDNPIDKVFQAWKLYQEKISEKGDPMPKIELTKIDAGDSINKIPSKAEAKFDVRTVPGFSSEEAVEKMEDVLNELGIDGEVCFVENPCPPSDSSGSEIVGFVKEVIESENSEFAKAANDACFFTAEGMTAAVVGPGQEDSIHSSGEFIVNKKLERGVEVYRRIAEEW